MIKSNVKQYNGVNETTLTHEGWFDAKGKPVIDKKLKAPKPAPDTEWLVFEKSMRGDPSDNIFSAYPGVRTKGTKNKIYKVIKFNFSSLNNICPTHTNQMV